MPQSGARRKPCHGLTVRAPRLPRHGQEGKGPFPGGPGRATTGHLLASMAQAAKRGTGGLPEYLVEKNRRIDSD
jgi:hypothetical protein